jgi:hypothetical protein
MSSIYQPEIDAPKANSIRSGTFDRMFNLPPQGQGIDDATITGWLTSLGSILIDNQSSAGNHPDLPAAYTYLGQFIDHDITFDPTRLPQKQIDISTLNNFRSPALDLDNLLGWGPTVSPLLYEGRAAGPNAGKLKTAAGLAGNPGGVSNDLPRLQDGTPLIGDPRNDENLLVGQFHTAFINFYNKVFEDLTSGNLPDPGPPGSSIVEKASKVVRWHYQWIILKDYLPRIIDQAILSNTILYGPKYYRPANNTTTYMPVEFAGAAFRFGHSLVRERYHVNAIFPNASLSDIFSFSSSGGGIPVPNVWFINWNRFVEIDPATPAQHSRKLDPYAAPTLQTLPGVPAPSSLIVRNLIRGWSWGLPSGQSVATAIGVPTLTSQQILFDPAGQPFPEASIVQGFGLDVDSPLWYYIMKEAEVLHAGESLGPVGSTILAEVFVGLLRADASSFLSEEPTWNPTLPSTTPGQFTLSDLFRYLPPQAINPNGGDTGPL